MNLNSLRTGGTPSDGEETESNQSSADTDSGKQRTWHRKLVLATAALALGMVLRRRQQAGTDVAGSPPADSTDRSATGTSGRSRTGGIGRRLKMLVISTIVFAIARAVIRRFRRKR